MRKAFDAVNHDFLLCKLSLKGVNDIAVKLSGSRLTFQIGFKLFRWQAARRDSVKFGEVFCKGQSSVSSIQLPYGRGDGFSFRIVHPSSYLLMMLAYTQVRNLRLKSCQFFSQRWILCLASKELLAMTTPRHASGFSTQNSSS